MQKPIHIFSWNRPFLPAFARFLDSENLGTLDVPLLVSPTYRPWQYLQGLLSRPGETRILPRLLTLTELVELWHKEVKRSSPTQASILDSVYLVWQAIDMLDEGEAKDMLASMDLNSFFPWGEKIASLVDEMLGCNILPEDVLACDDEVLPEAAKLLQSLGQIGENYLALLNRHNLTTTGLAQYEVAASLENPLPSLVRPTRHRPVYIMGFYNLNATRELILKRLWEDGATICLHTDPLVADPARRHRAHWICQRHVQLLEEWQAEAVLHNDEKSGSEKGSQPSVHFFSGYDLHSQLSRLRDDLQGLDTEQKACVLLPTAGLLMPTLHHVPESLRPHLNIAMGLCVADTPIFQLVHDLLLLQDNRDNEGRYHWKRLLACADSPLLAGLEGPFGEGILPAIRRYRTQLCRGLRFVDPFEDVLRAEIFDDAPAESAAMRELLLVLVTGFAEISTTEDLANALQGLCDHFNTRGTTLRSTSPVDMEALFHIEHRLIPMLRNTLLHESELGLKVLVRILDDFCGKEHMFFEPGASVVPDSPQKRHNPCEASLQIVNVLESTLLSFDRVYVLDATDDSLPGPKKHDPLLPDSLRAVLGLPDLRLEETETGYGILRLCKSSGEKFFYWQEGITRTWLFDGKKSRSRFVEEYIWELEQKLGRVLASGESPLEVARCVLTPMQPVARSLPVQDRIFEILQDRLASPLSPSAMDQYLSCPLQFGFARLAGLKALEMVNETDDPTGLGTLIHEVLETFHGRHLNELLEDREACAKELVEIFRDTLHSDSCLLSMTLPPASLAMLEAQGSRKLETYILNQPEDSRPILLERDISAHVSVSGRDISLFGRIDRMDRRKRGLVVLDYKTGTRINNVHPRLWTMDAFFEKVQDLTVASTLDATDKRTLHELFLTLRENAKSIQLPCYVTICTNETRQLKRESMRPDIWPNGGFGDAAFVALASKGEEIPIDALKRKGRASDEMDERHRRILSLCPKLVELVVLHMQHTEELVQMRDPVRCGRCSFAQLCLA